MWASTGGVSRLVDDLVPGHAGSDPTYLTNVDGTLFFFATNAAGDVELYASAGAAATTTPLGVITEPSEIVSVGGLARFLEPRLSDGAMELWSSDGTAQGTGMVVLPAHVNDENGDAIFDFSGSADLTAAGSTLYFRAESASVDDGAGDDELWSTNGTSAGTFEVTPPPSHSLTATDVNALVNVDGTLYFEANDSSSADAHADPERQGRAAHQPQAERGAGSHSGRGYARPTNDHAEAASERLSLRGPKAS